MPRKLAVDVRDKFMSNVELDSGLSLLDTVVISHTAIVEASESGDGLDAYLPVFRQQCEEIAKAAEVEAYDDLVAILQSLIQLIESGDIPQQMTVDRLNDWFSDMLGYLSAPHEAEHLARLSELLSSDQQQDSNDLEQQPEVEVETSSSAELTQDSDPLDGLEQSLEAMEDDDIWADPGLDAVVDQIESEFTEINQDPDSGPASDQPSEVMEDDDIWANPGLDDGADQIESEFTEIVEEQPISQQAEPSDQPEPEEEVSEVLVMLAEELADVSPQLDEAVTVIVETDDSEAMITAIGEYQELVSRVNEVTDALGLSGLVLVCEFIMENTLLLIDQPAEVREKAREVLTGWTQVVIQHLQAPKNDERCLAVVDYLEKENWPQPLAYRDVRALIEGLTKELELSGDYEVEQRETEATAADVELVIAEEVGTNLIDAFFAESPGHAEKLSALVEALTNGEDIQQNVEAAQRVAHTLKGSGNLVGASGVANLSHHMEDIFEHIAQTHAVPPQELADSLQDAADTLEAMIEYLQGMGDYPANAQSTLQQVLDWANHLDKLGFSEGVIPPMPTAEDSDWPSESAATDELEIASSEVAGEGEVSTPSEPSEAAVTAPAAAVAANASGTPASNQPEQASAPRNEAIRVNAELLDSIFQVVGETSIAIGQLQEHINRVENSSKQLSRNEGILRQRRYDLENLVSIRGMAARHRRAANAAGDNTFDPLEMDEYDEFYGATHAYIEGVSDATAILKGITGEVSNLNGLFQLQQRLNKQLQQLVMQTRMIPVASIVARLHRAVRQACRATGKSADLSIKGEELLIDGEVLSKLADPLMHLIRNAVDHGIESEDLRFEKGKANKGNITLEFRQEGNNVAVICSDDGSGLDFARIREVAISRGLMEDVAGADEKVLARMILQSGFSTRDQVTQVSGRGIGMDVVNTMIQHLNGSMDIGPADTGGTQVIMRLPITLLTSHCLLVSAGDGVAYAIPTATLTQILSPGTGEFGDVGGQQTFRLENDVFPAQSLNSLLGIPEAEDSRQQDKTVLLLQAGDGMTSITVDRVISSYDLVVKNTGSYVRYVPGVAGVSTLGDGSVVAVLDLATLIKQGVASGTAAVLDRRSHARAQPEQIKLPKVLVVDDSLSVRDSLSQLMSDGGFEVAVARDGLEAIDQLDKEQPDIVLTDLEMPRMNGLELASYMRKSEQWSGLPIIMVTSRTMAKHREQAAEAGVDDYITKPYTEDEVLASISDHLVESA